MMDVDDEKKVVNEQSGYNGLKNHVVDEDTSLLSSEEGEEIEQCFGLTAFLHSRNIDRAEMRSAQLDGKEVINRRQPFFDGFRIDTCANRTSVIRLGQYNAYCQTFIIPHSTWPTSSRIIATIGGKSEATGVVLMQVTFEEFRDSIAVYLLALKENVPMVV